MKPDLTDYQNNSKNEPDKSSRLVSWIVLGLALSGFIALAWYAYQSGTESVANQEIPTLEADNSPIKAKPEDAGGENFPHQDKTIYNVIAEDRAAQRVEKLIPEPEEPIMPTVREVVEAEREPNKANTWVNERLREDDVAEVAIAPEPEPVVEPAAEPVAEPVAAPAPVKEVAPKVEPKPAPTPEPVKPASKPEPKPEVKAEAPAPAVEKPAPVAAKGSHKLQLGAFGSNGEAEKNWKRIQDKNPLVLGGLPHVIVRADLPKGTFYRLRVSGFASKDAAAAACKKLTANGQGCFYAGK